MKPVILHPEALEEFKIQTGIYSAEYGRAVSQINATTKTGGNRHHGAVFHFLRTIQPLNLPLSLAG